MTEEETERAKSGRGGRPRQAADDAARGGGARRAGGGAVAEERPPRSPRPRSRREEPAPRSLRRGARAEERRAGALQPPRRRRRRARGAADARSSGASWSARSTPARRGPSAVPRSAPPSAPSAAPRPPPPAAAARARARSKHEPGEGTPPAEREPGVEEGPPGHGRLEQGRQDDHGADRGRPPPSRSTRRSSARSATIHAHDESNDANAGDIVRVIESRPMSRTKRWRLVEVLERAR